MEQGYLLVHCLGSWCIVRSAALAAVPNIRADLLHINGCPDSLPERKLRQDKLPGCHGGPRGAVDAVDPLLVDPLGLTYTERVFSRHSNKVNLLVYSPALKLCLSGEGTAELFGCMLKWMSI